MSACQNFSAFSATAVASAAPTAVAAPVAFAAGVARVAVPSAAARSARLARFEREQIVVDYLNRGVSVAEIAARVGVGEKRLRAVIREILARRMPHPPMEFVAIQVSRLNEALLVAFSAMSPTNLKAVDQVVKIVRELDRYGGAFAAEWARPDASGEGFSGSRTACPGLEAPTEADVAFAKAWLSEDEAARESSDDRPEIPLQSLENIENAPGISANPAAALPPGLSAGVGDAVDDRASDAPVDNRPGTPEIPAQGLEKAQSAPRIGTCAGVASASPAPAYDPVLSLLNCAAGRPGLAAYRTLLRERDAWRHSLA